MQVLQRQDAWRSSRLLARQSGASLRGRPPPTSVAARHRPCSRADGGSRPGGTWCAAGRALPWRRLTSQPRRTCAVPSDTTAILSDRMPAAVWTSSSSPSSARNRANAWPVADRLSPTQGLARCTLHFLISAPSTTSRLRSKLRRFIAYAARRTWQAWSGPP